MPETSMTLTCPLPLVKDPCSTHALDISSTHELEVTDDLTSG